MSSLAATQSDGFYFPPEWRPEFGGLSKYQGSKGANQYQTHGVIRFELPFDAWCMKCGRHMSKGLRFNAKKEKAPEKYFTTQIWSFSMRCPEPNCDQNFVIKTDPENDTYNMAEGMRKMEQDFEPEFNDSIIVATTDEERNLLATDPIFRLQHEKEDKRRALSAKEHLESLIDLQYSQKEKDYDMNSLLRKGNRQKRKRAIFLLEEGKARGLNIPLVEEHESDSVTAKSIRFRANSAFTIAERSKKNAVMSQSIFSKSASLKVGSEKKSLRDPSRAQGPETTVLSSEAKKQQKFHAAMAKQAIVNINTKQLKVADSSSSSHLVDSSSNIRNVPKILSSISFQHRSLKNNVTIKEREAVTSSIPNSSKALTMLAMYSDDDDDPN